MITKEIVVNDTTFKVTLTDQVISQVDNLKSLYATVSDDPENFEQKIATRDERCPQPLLGTNIQHRPPPPVINLETKIPHPLGHLCDDPVTRTRPL